MRKRQHQKLAFQSAVVSMVHGTGDARTLLFLWTSIHHMACIHWLWYISNRTYEVSRSFERSP